MNITIWKKTLDRIVKNYKDCLVLFPKGINEENYSEYMTEELFYKYHWLSESYRIKRGRLCGLG